MRILITGGSGFIGSNLIRYILGKTAHEVLNLDKLTYAGNPASLSDLQDHPRYAFRKGDIGDLSTLRALFEAFAPEAVIHLAAESHVDRSMTLRLLSRQIFLEPMLFSKPAANTSAKRGTTCKRTFAFFM